MSPLMKLRTFVLLVGGVTVCAALVVGFPLIFFEAQGAGPPLPPGDFAQGSVFVLFAGVVLGLSLRASRRVRSGAANAAEVFTRTASIVPFLVLGGGLFGAWAGHSIASQRREHDLDSARRACEQPAVWGFSDQHTCEEQSLTCRRSAWSAPLTRSDSQVTALVQRLQAEHTRLDAEEMKARKAGGWPDTSLSRALEHAVDDLTGTWGYSDLDRGALVCLWNHGKH